MLIHTPNHQLHVLRILQQNNSVVTYICTDITEDPHTYLLNGFLQSRSYQQLIPMVMEQKNAYFTDFVEYFSADGIFYMLFRCWEGTPVLEKADAEDMETRLEYVRCLLEQLVLQSMPLAFQYAVLLPERVVVTERKQVRFRYLLPEQFGQREIQFHDMELRLRELVEKLLIPELSMRYSLALLAFCRNLDKGGVYTDLQAIYAAYTAIQQELLAQRGHLVSHKIQFQLWEKCKQHAAAVRRVVAVLAIAAAAVLIVWQTFLKQEIREKETDLAQIGSLSIRENQPALPADEPVTEAGQK